MSKLMSKKMMRITLSFVVLLIIWQFIAFKIDNDVLIPFPKDVFHIMLSQVGNIAFYEIISHTLFRTISGFVIALLFALASAFLSYFYKIFEDLFYPFLLLTRSVPNISFIIIVLFWFSSESSVVIISFLILFPTIYANLIQGLRSLSITLQDVLRVYPVSKAYAVRKIYLPQLTPYLFASASSGISLAFKVGIMAEILGQVTSGIGRQLNISRMNLDMAGVFAWTFWIILLLFLMERLFSIIMRKYSHGETQDV